MLREGNHSENLVLNGRILLKCFLKERLGSRGIHCSVSGQGEMAAFCERHNEYLGAINPLNPELNPICYLLALLGTHHFLHVSRIRVKSLILRHENNVKRSFHVR